ncbi:hypothetical protein [Paraburkholderia sp. BL25I1N1]|uniref:hypothetical protein n=1 Tax=Paraburkholderia sp. BL25I1N1 TaxID=1938804 RepID=UPI000D487DCB|nr:hypothetical protein [Paraburkholderia sp. BL25I1N1]PRX98310.1 hypothetical protein B0G73_1256 [Paraburkholderia sp. BL25I1N1]
MEKWLVVLGIWAMCATCAVLFMRGATSGPGRREPDEEHVPAASRASVGDARTALNE